MSLPRYALVSVTDKTGVTGFCSDLINRGFSILSTGGTAKVLEDAGLKITKVSEYTGHPEIFDGRVKTLHPKVHGAILYDRSNKDHLDQKQELNLPSIDLVVANLYDFEANVIHAKKDDQIKSKDAQVD